MTPKKKRILIFVLVAVLLILACAIAFWHSQRANEITVDNIFDQLYLEVNRVKNGKTSVLITGNESAYADYDFGEFQSIQIQELEMSLSVNENTLHILFFNRSGENNSKTVHYRYDVSSKTLYAEESVNYLVHNFLAAYFQWCKDVGQENKFSLLDFGEYNFVQQERVTY